MFLAPIPAVEAVTTGPPISDDHQALQGDVIAPSASTAWVHGGGDTLVADLIFWFVLSLIVLGMWTYRLGRFRRGGKTGSSRPE
jgi:hypothetical protein